MKVRTPYNYDRDTVSRETGIQCDPDDPHQADQQFKEEADINTIMRRFGLTGQIPQNFKMPLLGDFTGAPDYQTALNMVRHAQQTFMTVPAEIRERFQHNPQKLMAFLENPANKDEAQKLGLLRPPRELARDGSALPLRVEVVQSTPPTPGEGAKP